MYGSSDEYDTEGNATTEVDSDEEEPKLCVENVTPNEPQKPPQDDTITRNPFYLLKSMGQVYNRRALSANEDNLKQLLKSEKGKGIKHSLSSFLPRCADINEAEMVQEVKNGLKSYDKDANEICALRSAMKFRQRTSYLAPIDFQQLEGFKILPIQKPPGLATVLPKIDDKTKQTKPKKLKTGPSPLVVTLKKTGVSEWKMKEKPQHIVPIYSEQISGKRKMSKYLNFESSFGN